MAASIPQDRSAEATSWLVRLLDRPDRVTLVHHWQAGMPPPAFALVKQHVKDALGEEWSQLSRSIPDLE